MQTSNEESGFYDATGPEPRPISKAEALGEGVDDAEQTVEAEAEERARISLRVMKVWLDGAIEDETVVDVLAVHLAPNGGGLDLSAADMETLRWLEERLPASQDDTDDAGEDKGVEDTAEGGRAKASSDEVFDQKVDTLVENLDVGMTVAEAVAATNKAFAEDMGLYGASVEDAAKRVAMTRGMELMGQRIRRELRAKLDDHEAAERGREMAELVGERDEVEEDKKSYVRRANERIKDLEERISTLAKPIREGADEILVDCCLLADFPLNVVHVVRLDTGEDVETRAMTGPERTKLAQPPLPFDGEVSVATAAAEAEAAQPVARDPSDPPELEQGYHPAAMRTDPDDVPRKGLVTAGCAEHATFYGAHTMGGQRWACYDLDGHRYAFVAWPEPESEAAPADDEPMPVDEAPVGDDTPTAVDEAAALDAELGECEDDDEFEAGPDEDEDEGSTQVGKGWRGTDPALVNKARTKLTGIVTPDAAK